MCIRDRVVFTFVLLGWILAASFSTTPDIFAGKVLDFETGLHFENYTAAWGDGGVATFFTCLLYTSRFMPRSTENPESCSVSRSRPDILREMSASGFLRSSRI